MTEAWSDELAGELATVLGHDPGPVTVTPLRHNARNTVTVGLWRYAGVGWSVVLKEVSPAGEGLGHWVSSEEPQHWNYWRREPLGYRSGLTASAYEGSGIVAPRLLDSFDRPDGAVALWLEDARGLPGAAWDVERVAVAARQLGRGQGGYLTGRPLPEHPWLSRRFLRQYVLSKPVAGTLLRDDDVWARPEVRAAYSGLRPGLERLWAERESLLRTVESLPQTLAHCDVWPANLIARGDETVLLDWSFVGVGAIGEDAGNLVPDCVFDGFLPVDALPALADGVWSAYLAGLRGAGWAGDEGVARLGFVAAGAVKYCWLAEWSLRKVLSGQLSSYGGYSERTAEELLTTYAEVFRLLLGWAEEARALTA